MTSAGILNLPITSLPVDNCHDRALWCKSTGINYNMHGWILCRYCATGWFWWISGLRAVTMWSSSSFTKRHGGYMLLVPTQVIWEITCPMDNGQVVMKISADLRRHLMIFTFLLEHMSFCPFIDHKIVSYDYKFGVKKLTTTESYLHSALHVYIFVLCQITIQDV